MSLVLHMDVEAVLAVARELREMQTHLERYTSSLQNHVYGLPPDWQGGSATEFFELYGEWHSAITGFAGDLGEIADKLAKEAANWVEADRTF